MNIISLLHNESNGDKEMGMQSELEHELDNVQITSILSREIHEK